MEEDNRWVFFRFWDPRTLLPLLRALDEKDANKLIHSYQFMNPTSGSLTSYWVTNPMDENQRRELPPFIMKEDYIAAFSSNQQDAFIKQLDDFISKQSDAFTKLETDKKTERLNQLIQQAKEFGIGVEQAVANFVLASVQFGKDLAGEPRFEKILTSTHHEIDKATMLLNEIQSTTNPL